MDLNETDTVAQDQAATCKNTTPETSTCWSAIDNLLHLVNCDLVNFSLYEKSHHSENARSQFESPVMQRWARYSGSVNCENIPNNSVPLLHELITDKTLDEICSINSSNGGSNEIFIYPLKDLGCIRIVFLDSEPPEGSLLSLRQKTIDQVFPHLTSCFSHWLSSRKRSRKGEQLTIREKEVLYWIKEGKSTWESAQILGITERTVKYHLKNIFRKLNSNNRAQAVSRAVEQGLFE